jgi:hypothetical protein
VHFTLSLILFIVYLLWVNDAFASVFHVIECCCICLIVVVHV